jgi:hypothetical protein
MPKNFEKTALALVNAALNSQQASAPAKPAAPSPRKRRVSTGRAMLLGAGLMVAGQALVKSRGRDALNSVRHGLAERIDGTGPDEVEALEDDVGLDEELEVEDMEYDGEPEDDEDEQVDLEDAEDEDPTPRAPRRKVASRGRGRS